MARIIIICVMLLFLLSGERGASRISMESDHLVATSHVENIDGNASSFHTHASPLSSSERHFVTLQEWLYLPESQEIAKILHHSNTIERKGVVPGDKGHTNLSDFFHGEVFERDISQPYKSGSCGRYVVIAHQKPKSLQTDIEEQMQKGDIVTQNVSFQFQRRPRVQADTLSILSHSELEVHVIDSRHVLVYLPTGDESDIAGALASQSITLSDSLGEWKVIDVYGSMDSVKPRPELFLFKISRPLKELLTAAQDCNSENCDVFVVQARRLSRRMSSLHSSFVPSQTTHELQIIVSTARGQSRRVAEDISRITSIEDVEEKGNESDGVGAETLELHGVRVSKPCRFSVAAESSLLDETSGVVQVNLTFLLQSVTEQNYSHRFESDALKSARVCVLKILKIAFHPSVRWLEAKPLRVELFNSKASPIIQSGYNIDMNRSLATPFWDVGLNGTGEIVALSDTGVDVRSCYFHDPKHPVAHYPDVNFNHRKIISYYGFSMPGTNEADYGDTQNGHGTHVACSAVGSVFFDSHTTSDYSKDVMKFSLNNGVAPGAKLFFVDLAYGEEKMLTVPSTWPALFDPGYKAGARIFSNSWGFEGHREYSSSEKMIDTYIYQHDDALMLFSSGNRASDIIPLPATSKNVLTIGAHSNSFHPAEQNSIPQYSFGPTYDNRQKPDLVTSGAFGVVSAKSNVECDTVLKSGTSMATGLAAGAAALVREYLRTRLANNMPSASLMKALMIHSTVFLVERHRSGFGRLDLSIAFGNQRLRTKSAIAKEVAAQPQLWMVERKPISERETHVYCFSAIDPITLQSVFSSDDAIAADLKPETMLLKATLVWTDIAIALEGSKHTLVHDLDLAVVDYSGKIYYSNTDQPNKKMFDRTNTVEQVRIELTEKLSTGFRVLVYGNEIRGNQSQEYSLVVSAPGLKAKENCINEFARLEQNNTHVYCPGNCSGPRGAMCLPDSRMCECSRNFSYYDCSLCDEMTYCNGHGACNSETMTCACFPGTHFSDPYCSVCSEGWYGPRCDFDCLCMNNATCDQPSGVCKCSQDPTYGGHGCYAGRSCEHCCRGFTGKHCNELSYWCDESGNTVEVNNMSGGYIQISGLNSYPNFFGCHWLIKAPPGSRILLYYIGLELKDSEGTLFLYDPVSEKGLKAPLRADKGIIKNEVKVKSIGNILHLVLSSTGKVSAGNFLIRYRFLTTMDCQVGCKALSNLPENAPPILTCGNTFGLFNWCICISPHVGWNCNTTRIYSTFLTNSSEVVRHRLRPQYNFISSVALLVLDMLPFDKVLHSMMDAGSNRDAGKDGLQNNKMHSASVSRWTLKTIPIEGITRMPLVVNGYSLLRVRAPINASSPSLSDVDINGLMWFVNLTLIPINSAWAYEVQGLNLGVSQVRDLDSHLLFSDFSRMQLLDLSTCQSKSSLSMLVPLNVRTFERDNGGRFWATTELLVTLLWNASETVSWQYQKHLTMDMIVLSSALSYNISSTGENAFRSTHANEFDRFVNYEEDQFMVDVDFELTCGPHQGLNVGLGRSLRQLHIEKLNKPIYIRHSYLTVVQVAFLIICCFVCVTGITFYKQIRAYLVSTHAIEFSVIGNDDENSTPNLAGEELVASPADNMNPIDDNTCVISTVDEPLETSPTQREEG